MLCSELRQGGVGTARFNMATWGVAGGKTPAVRPLTAYVLPRRIAVLFDNKANLNLFQERCKAAPQRISG